jgi:hypothetical protein
MAKKIPLTKAEVSRRHQHRAEATAHLRQLDAAIDHLDYVDLRAFTVNALDAPIAALQALANSIRAQRFGNYTLKHRNTSPIITKAPVSKI